MTEQELRELDAEVAVEVMGYVYVNGRDDGDGDKYTLLMLPEEAAKWCKRFPTSRIEKEPWAKPYRDGGHSQEDLFPVSIAAAWQVLEKVSSDFELKSVRFHRVASGVWAVILSQVNWSSRSSMGYSTDGANAMADNLPLAICLAARTAVRNAPPASGS